MLRTVMGFDHIAKNVGDTWFANSGYDILRTVPGSGKPIIIDSDGALGCPLGAHNGGPTQASINFSKYLVAGVNSIVLAFRMKVIVGPASGPLFYLGSLVNGADASWVCNATSLPAAALVLNTETFIELDMNFTTWIVSVYANGVLAANIQLTSTVVTAIKNGSLVLFLNANGQNLSSQLSFRDFYLLDNVTGDGFVTRQGDRRVKLIDFDVASGAGWTTTDGSGVLATLKAAPETANPAFAVAPGTKAPLELSMKSTFNDTYLVEAVAVQLAGKVDATGGFTKTQMKDGANSSVVTPLRSELTTVLKYGVPGGVYPRHPSGVRWNNANIDTASFVVVPDQVS